MVLLEHSKRGSPNGTKGELEHWGRFRSPSHGVPLTASLVATRSSHLSLAQYVGGSLCRGQRVRICLVVIGRGEQGCLRRGLQDRMLR